MNRENKELLGFSKVMLFQCIILFLGMSAGVWINKYFLVLMSIFTVLVAVIKSIDDVYYHLFFTMPFTVIYKLSPTSTSLFAYVIIVVGLILMFRIRLFRQNPFFAILIFSIYIICGMGNNYTTVIKMIMGLVLFYFFTESVETKNFKNHIMAFSLGTLGSSVIGLFRGSLSRLDAYFYSQETIYSDGILSTRFAGLNYDPNYYAMLAMFAIVLCGILFLKKDGNRILLGAVILFQTYFGFITYSKMFLISFLIAAIMFIVYGNKSLKTIFLTFISIFFLGMILYYWAQKSGYLDIMYKRLFEGDISTGRLGLWKHYLNSIESTAKAILIGVGLGSGYLEFGGPHNTYLEAIYFVGIIGSILFLLAVILIFNRKKNIQRKNVVNYVLLIVFAIMIGVLGCFTINELMFYFMLLWIAINTNVNRSNFNYENTKDNANDKLIRL